jgi:hypothetical protein
MRKFAVRCLLLAAVLAGTVLEAGLSKPVVSYDLKARLRPGTRTVEGSETLTWLNDSGAPVSELRFHLYLNAFQNNRSTFMVESGALASREKRPAEDWGRIDVTSLRIPGGPDLAPTLEFVQPDDGNQDDRTVARVPLPSPVPPGGRITLEIEFVSKLPKVIARSGYVGEFYLVGQWFPKLGVFQNGAWNCHQYHAHSEFFADFGLFKAELTVPEKYIVGATGKRIGERTNADGTKTYTHYQDDVHDFAWTACPDFREFREKFVLDDPKVETEMILLVHRAHLGQKDRYVRSLRQGIEFYSRNYGAYPYPTITLVDPAPGAMAAGGMEYPTFFTSDTMSWLPAGVRMPELVTIHEFGHNYWYGMVGSNEFEEAWLDEGINTYSEIKAMDHYYGADRSMLDLFGVRLGEVPYQRLTVIGSGRFDPILKNSWSFIGGSYTVNVYSKAGLMMLTLEKMLGEPVMGKVMKTYFETWKFRHPTSRDFVRVAEDVSGRDLGWFFDQVLSSPDKLDYGISDLRTFEIAAPDGVFDGGKAPSDKESRSGEERKAPGTPKLFRSVVTAARTGEMIFPQEILVTFENGEKVREFWDGRDRWTRFVYDREVRVRSAEVDPEHRLALDVNYLNNSRVMDAGTAAPMKFGAGLLKWFQGLLSFIAM